MNNLFRFFFILLFSFSIFSTSIAQKSPKLGEPAPEIHITKWLQGETDLKGKTLFLTFFESWCGNCIRIVKQMNELEKKYSSDDFVFLYLSSENLSRIERYLKRAVILPSVVHDKGDATIKSYRVTGVPESFIINKDGILVWRGHPGKLTDKHFDDYLESGKTPERRFKGPV